MRLRALLLLALFLGAGSSLPSLDAVLYHMHGTERFAGDTHLDPAGGCGGHADHCTLGRTSPGSRSVQPWTVVVRSGPAPGARPPRARRVRARSLSPRGTLPRLELLRHQPPDGKPFATAHIPPPLAVGTRSHALEISMRALLHRRGAGRSGVRPACSRLATGAATHPLGTGHRHYRHGTGAGQGHRSRR